MTQSSARAKRQYLVPLSLSQPSTLFDSTAPEHTLRQQSNDKHWVHQHTANLLHITHTALRHNTTHTALDALCTLYQRPSRLLGEVVYKGGLAVLGDTRACLTFFQYLLSQPLRAPSTATYVRRRHITDVFTRSMNK